MASPTPDPYPTSAVRRQANAANIQRAVKRITSGQAYTQASIKRLASAGVNVGSVLRDTPNRGLPGALAGQKQVQQKQAAQQNSLSQRAARQQALVKRAQQRLAMGKGGQASLKRVAAPKGVSVQREQQLMKQYNGNVPENAR